MTKSELAKKKKDELLKLHAEKVGGDAPATKEAIIEALLSGEKKKDEPVAAAFSRPKPVEGKEKHVSVIVLHKEGLKKAFPPYAHYTGKFGENIPNVPLPHAQTMEQEGKVKIVG